MSIMRCKRCGANEDRINGFCSVECEEYYRLEEEIGALDSVILERGVEISRLNARIAELQAERDKAKAAISRLRDFLYDYTQFHISTNPEERWWALVDKFEELTKEVQG